jgi:hypothetical protein
LCSSAKAAADGREAEAFTSVTTISDGDGGQPDIVFHFRTQDAGIQCGQPLASLTGKTADGLSIEGFGSIKTNGCKYMRIYMGSQLREPSS